MKKRKGFSLVEAIISVVLLGVVSLILITGIMTSYKFLMQTKFLTSDAYSAMQETENLIKDIRTELNSPDPDLTGYTVWGRDLRLFGAPVNAYEVCVDGEYGTIWTLVGKNSYASLPTPSIIISAALVNGNFEGTSWLNSDLSVKSTETVVDNTEYMMTTYRWYVSKEGYYISSNDESDYLSGDQYPAYPTDYTAINSAMGTSSTMSLSANDYLGRHVLIAATPVATSGKMGTPAISNSVYISGLPYTSTSLKMHLDASLINLEDYETYLAGSGTVNRWTDFTGNGNDAVTRPSGAMILNTTCEFGDSYANALGFDSGISMTAGSNLPGMSEFTMFLAVNCGPGSAGNVFMKDTTDSFRLSLNQLTFGTNSLMLGNVPSDVWHVFGISVMKSGEGGRISVRIDNGAVQEMQMNDSNLTAHFANMLIGTDGVSLAEIILYEEALDYGNYDRVWSYLTAKYGL